jgi:hypothetical protein
VKRREQHSTSREALQKMARGRRCWLLVVVVLATAAGPRANFYDPPSLTTHHHPGDILRTEPFSAAPAGTTATRMLYVSTTPNGRPIAVSALVIVPSGAAPAHRRPVLAWLHPTTGVVRSCAPTLGPDPFGQIQGLSEFLAAGDVVVATDYPGLRGPGVHPYLLGASEAFGARFGPRRPTCARRADGCSLCRLGAFARRPCRAVCRSYRSELRAGAGIGRRSRGGARHRLGGADRTATAQSAVGTAAVLYRVVLVACLRA